MPILPAFAIARSRALFGSRRSGLYPHTARILREGTTGTPSPNASGVARSASVIVADDRACRLDVPSLGGSDGTVAAAPTAAPSYTLSFPIDATEPDGGALDVQYNDVIRVTGPASYPGAAFVLVLRVTAVDPPAASDIRRRVAAVIAPPGTVTDA